VISWVFVGTTVVLTTYGQLIIKWQIGKAGELPDGLAPKIEFLLRMFLNPWVISAFVLAFIASLTWMAALSRLDLSRAYPFMATSFVIVILSSAIAFHEALTVPKVVGILLIFAGLAVGSQT
jgi:drug/metabolite transporter (DMT)-like permease